MDGLKIFEYQAQRAVRVLNITDGPWFVAKDVCDILDIKNSRDAVERLDSDEKLVSEIPTSGQRRNVQLINEAGLYSLVLTSNKPEARAFKRWVTHEVLPSIRREGRYEVTLQSFEEKTLEVLSGLQERVKALAAKVESDKPKVAFFEAVTGSRDCIDIGEAARVLNVKGVGRNDLFKFLREQRVLMGNNQPYQEFIDRGYFRCIEQTYQTPDGATHINIKTVVYQTGVSYIRTLLRKTGLVRDPELGL